MKITLRKANAIQNSIVEHVKTIEIKTSIELNEFQKVATEIARARETLITNDRRRERLTTALFDIRTQVNRNNSTSGVSDLLARAANIDRRLVQLKQLIESPATDDEVIIDGKLEKIRQGEAAKNVYNFRDTVQTGILTQKQIASYQADMLNLKKEKQKINDQILEINVKTEFTLNSDTVDILTTEGLI